MASIGLVIPAYRPDVDQLAEYVFALEERIEPETIRIELDAPESVDLDRLNTVPALVHTVPYRRGKGAAITAGFEGLDTDVLAFADADGSTPAAELESVLEAVTRGQADLAVGSRRHPDATITSHQTPGRRYLGDSFAWVARHVLDADLHDFQCGAKVITSSGWANVRDHLYASGFAWDLELVAIAEALGLSIAEIPIEWHDQPGSTVSPVRTSLELARALFVARHRAERLRDSRLHAAIADRREEPDALVDRDR